MVPPWAIPLVPYVPAVQALDDYETLELDAAFELPLGDESTYPPEPIARVPIPHREELCSRLELSFGFFPAADAKLTPGADGKLVPSYYAVRRQFLVTRRLEGLPPIPVRRPLWGRTP